MVKLAYNSIADTAFIYDEQALSLAKKIKYQRGIAWALSQYTNDFLAVNNYPKAMEYCLESLKINEKIKNLRGLTTNYLNISRVYMAQGDNNKAISFLNKSINICKNINLFENLRLDYWALGKNYEALNKLDSALAFYQRSYELFSFDKDNQMISDLLSSLGDIHERLGHRDIAKAYYTTGIEKITPGLGSVEFGKNYYGLAILFQQQSNIDSSIHYAKKSFEAAKGNPEMIAKSSLLLSKLYETIDDKQAFYFYKLATITKDSIYEASKLLMMNNMSFNEEQRQHQKDLEELNAKIERKHNLQYAAIAIALITFIILFLLLSRSIVVKTKFIEFFGVLGLLAVFEFINLFIHPYLANATNDSPVLMLIVLIAIGALLIPLHHRLEKWITKIMVEKNKKVRLHAAKKTIQELEGN